MSFFSENLKSIRQNSKILQKNLAVHLNIPLRTYQSYEYGDVEPNIDTLIALADYFDVSIDYLVGRSEEPKIHIMKG